MQDCKRPLSFLFSVKQAEKRFSHEQNIFSSALKRLEEKEKNFSSADFSDRGRKV